MAVEKSAGAVVFRKENNRIYYLLLHYTAGHWDFPKGHIEKGESWQKAARREILEETGIKQVRFISGFKKNMRYFFKKYPEKGKQREIVFKIVTFFLGETPEKSVKISSEHKGYKWLPYKEAVKQVTFINAKKLIQTANAFLSAKSF